LQSSYSQWFEKVITNEPLLPIPFTSRLCKRTNIYFQVLYLFDGQFGR
jgi:hypothetical protein